MDSESREMAVEAFRRAQQLSGGHSALAKVCGCTPGNIWQLLEKGSLVPGRFVLKIEAATGVSRHDLRPDLYPREDGAAQPPAPSGDTGSTSPKTLEGARS